MKTALSLLLPTLLSCDVEFEPGVRPQDTSASVTDDTGNPPTDSGTTSTTDDTGESTTPTNYRLVYFDNDNDTFGNGECPLEIKDTEPTPADYADSNTDQNDQTAFVTNTYPSAIHNAPGCVEILGDMPTETTWSDGVRLGSGELYHTTSLFAGQSGILTGAPAANDGGSIVFIPDENLVTSTVTSSLRTDILPNDLCDQNGQTYGIHHVLADLNRDGNDDLIAFARGVTTAYGAVLLGGVTSPDEWTVDTNAQCINLTDTRLEPTLRTEIIDGGMLSAFAVDNEAVLYNATSGTDVATSSDITGSSGFLRLKADQSTTLSLNQEFFTFPTDWGTTLIELTADLDQDGKHDLVVSSDTLGLGWIASEESLATLNPEDFQPDWTDFGPGGAGLRTAALIDTDDDGQSDFIAVQNESLSQTLLYPRDDAASGGFDFDSTRAITIDESIDIDGGNVGGLAAVWGAPNFNSRSGVIFLYPGAFYGQGLGVYIDNSQLTEGETIRLHRDSNFPFAGPSGNTAGSLAFRVSDVDEDGYDDIVMGAPVWSSTTSGQDRGALLLFASEDQDVNDREECPQ